MAHFLKTADPDLIILENGLLGVDYARMALEVAPNGGQKLAILNLGTAKGMPKPANYPRPIISLPPGFSFDAPDVLPELPEDCRGYADSPVVCFTTSGTTGPSKLAMHRQSAVVRMSVDLSWCWDMKPAKGTVMQGQLRYGKVLDWGGRREKMELDVGEPSFETRIRDILLLTVPWVYYLYPCF